MNILIRLVFSLIFTIQRLFDSSVQVGWTSIFVIILFLSGIQLVFLGIISEYIGKLYLDLNGTPQYSLKYESQK